MSNKPHRVQLRRAKGWRMPPNTVSVARPTKWGNPWTVEGAKEVGYGEHAAEYCVELYREWLRGDPGSLTRMLGGGEGEARVAALRKALSSLRGKNLACWCKPGEPCHADVLLDLANQ